MAEAKARSNGSPTARDIEEIRRILEPMLGLPAWAPSLGYGSFLTFEFGAEEERRPRRGAPYVHGEWHLWIYASSWRLETSTEVLAASEDSRAAIAAAVAMLDGRAIEDIDIAIPSFDTSFDFGDGYTLRVFPIYSGAGSDDPEHWMLFTPGHMVLAIGPGVTWSYERSDQPSATSGSGQLGSSRRMTPSIEEALADLGALVEAWCDRRALVPLRHLLPAYSSPLAHVDEFDELRKAAHMAWSFGHDELQGDEEDRLADIEAALDAHIRTRVGAG